MAGLRAAQEQLVSPASYALVGDHPLTVKVRAVVERVAGADATVLITGESGTGKEIVARAIHAQSPRRDHAFVPVNCAAIPHDMLESEMFGHERGAFTGAIGPRQGLFTFAAGGTIFLDEISEMPLGLQAKLLRVLEDLTVRPLGSDRAHEVDVRVIAASNRDLAAAVKNNAFRGDLFYRLQVVPILIPALRERRSDIPLLAGYFLARVRARFPGREFAISREAMVHLWAYDWPGNVRELENLIQQMAILCEGDLIDATMLPQSVLARGPRAEPLIPPVAGDGQVDFDALVREFEGRLINDALRRTGGNKQAAARFLGLKRTTFTAKLRRCGVVLSSGLDDASLV